MHPKLDGPRRLEIQGDEFRRVLARRAVQLLDAMGRLLHTFVQTNFVGINCAPTNQNNSDQSSLRTNFVRSARALNGLIPCRTG